MWLLCGDNYYTLAIILVALTTVAIIRVAIMAWKDT